MCCVPPHPSLTLLLPRGPCLLIAYSKRKEFELGRVSSELSVLEAQARFVAMTLRGEIPIFKRAPTHEVIQALHSRGFEPNIGSAKGLIAHMHGDESRHGEEKQDLAIEVNTPGDRAYDYLLQMPLASLTEERAAKLEDTARRKHNQVSSPAS